MLLRAVTSPAMLYARNVSPYASERDVREVSILTGNYIIDIILVTTLTLKVLVATIDAQWEGMGDVGSARYEPALLPPCPTIRVFKG